MEKTLKDYEYFRTDLGVLYHGDCLEILPLIDNVDFGFTDPPYGINKAEWDSEFNSIFINIFEKKCIGGEITTGDNNIGTCINLLKNYTGLMHNFNRNGMTFNKVGFENIITGVLFGKIKRGQNYIVFTVGGEKPDHPSPKPLKMILKTIERFTKENQSVLDCFLGSGTTAIACEKLNRKWIGIEISEKYCEIAKKRIKAEADQFKMQFRN